MRTTRSRISKHPEISDQMLAWSSALASEVAEWPRASARSFFGFTALYRGDAIFGMVPRTKSFGTGSEITFRIDDPAPKLRARLENDPRVGRIDPSSTRWFTFKLSDDADLHEALDWLGIAYQYVTKRKKAKK